MTQPLWSPSKAEIEQTQIYQFIQELNRANSLELSNYSELHRWSIEHSEKFWSLLWDSCKVLGAKARPLIC